MWNPLRLLGTFVVFACGCVLGILGTFLFIAAGWIAPERLPGKTAEWGMFAATPRVELLDDGRKLKLLDDFVYVDPEHKVWVAHRDWVVDGASIPRAFWTVTGGPLEGRFRNASIIHDEACDRMAEPWQKVHLAFYQACRCGGMSEMDAKVLYAAVYHFGPRWTIRQVAEQRTSTGPDGKQHTFTVKRPIATVERRMLKLDANAPKKLGQYIGSRNPSLAEIEKLDPSRL